ncbi:hypothetical protein NE857_11670 [Nocardiopsis exhalans]|uniref:ABM domain-containing protein n=1 Tax=Nocardiopsis exhalans TaxID=163604 RepID=A0ABY5DCZ6_9ACTN|nr:hypothetical protein [Nocardiopsis exhalans]USY22202.1 hypothetical protein NE857_11670 [Nocardiopsis exhalans]
MTLEYVRFETNDAAALTTARGQLIARLKERYGSDFLSATLVAFDDGSIGDVILWNSREAAERAAKEMPSDPASADFFGQIGAVREMSHAEVLHSA